MKQVILNPQNGKIEVIDVPAPKPELGQVLVRNLFSLISAGTERSTVSYAKMNLLQKAKARPDLVKQVVDKLKQDGILPTINAVLNRLTTPILLGYSSAGIVEGLGDEVFDFKIGDKVACGGGGYASHSEIILVPKNLVVKIPQNVDFDEAAFTTLGAIAMQGVRLSNLKIGEIGVVIGLGLLGQLTHQILKASGVKTVGFDINSERTSLADSLGIDFSTNNLSELYTIVSDLTGGHGADAVIITASTKSNEPVEIAGDLCRKKGNVVVVGAVGLNIPREPYYEKELNFVISCSYGPGRYDPAYEEKGIDYPYGYVRWTENRNMQAFLDLLSEGKVKVKPLITHVFPVEKAQEAYEIINSGKGIGVLLRYPFHSEIDKKIVLKTTKIENVSLKQQPLQPLIGVLGAGSFAMSTILPNLKKMKNVVLIGVASAKGISARKAAYRFKFNYFTSDENEILNDPSINTVFILTRHNLHAKQVIQSLKSNKVVYVEKPLCIKKEELDEIIAVYSQMDSPPYLFVGFNRRFAPFISLIKEILRNIFEPIIINIRVNAGFIPKEHWIQDPQIGGGRLIGEACHFIDLAIYLANSKVTEVTTKRLPDLGKYSMDNFVINLMFENGSVATITYIANGNKSMGKEYIEIFGAGTSIRMDDYKKLEVYSDKFRLKKKSYLSKDKGHRNEIETFIKYLTGKSDKPMSVEEIIHSTKVTLCAYESLITGKTVKIE